MNPKRLRLVLILCSYFLIPNIANAFYATHLGRWTSRDPGLAQSARIGAVSTAPIGAPGAPALQFSSPYQDDGPNLYQYVRSNPILLTDPSGRYAVCCSFYNGSERWSETVDCQAHFELPGDLAAAACCGDRGSGLWDWEVIGSRTGGCNSRPPSDLCNEDWTQMDWLDCMSCCIKNAGGRPVGGAGAASGVVGYRVPKPHVQPGQYPDQSWLYGPRRCLPKSIRPTLNTTRTVGRWAGRVFILLGLVDAGIDGYCATQCSGP
jgi:hypothetical protein